MRIRLLYFLLISFLIPLSSCSQDPEPPAAGIGPLGGISSSEDQKASISIPPDAFSEHIEVFVTQSRSNSESSPFESLSSETIGKAYRFLFNQDALDGMATITIDYDDEDIPLGMDLTRLALGHFSERRWKKVLGSVLDLEAKQLSGSATETGYYGIVGFVAVSKMTEGRRAHTATLLPNGKVLIAGGYGDLTSAETPVFSSTELYDSEQGSFSVSANMIKARAFHTATLLQNGKVLITGGENKADDDSKTSAELYDPENGSFSETGRMFVERSAHSATLLDDGKVLITGGLSAELYDPKTGTFRALEGMDSCHSHHSSTRLTDGTVLLVGGNCKDQRTERYDPRKETFDVIEPPESFNAWQTATLLGDGRVLLTGGWDGETLSIESRHAELYDPDTEMFSSIEDMNLGRSRHTATILPDGRVLIVGGYGSAMTEVFDPAEDTFSPYVPMSDGRTTHSAVLLNTGEVLITGGAGWGDESYRAEVLK